MSWESFPGVLHLTFHHCFKVKWGHHAKTSLISPLMLVLWLQNVKADHEKGRPWSRDYKMPSVHASVCEPTTIIIQFIDWFLLSVWLVT